MPRVDLVYDADCPHVALARENLMRGFARSGMAARWQEHLAGDPDNPARVRGFGSPTVLVDGEDVMGEGPGTGACCRLYDGHGGAPSVDAIARALAASAATAAPPRRVRSTLGVLPGVVVAFMPKLACPLCWPAYAAVLGALGVPFLMQARWLVPITGALLSVALGAIAWRARSRRGYGPFFLALGGAFALVAGKFWLDAAALTDAGVAAFIAASVWNALPRRRSATKCAACG